MFFIKIRRATFLSTHSDNLESYCKNRVYTGPDQ
uniref:Uncharacterized protein n=1 Tax=Arundo donax TaxID=35708 RepID=A0A0A9HSK6_ARUDO